MAKGNGTSRKAAGNKPASKPPVEGPVVIEVESGFCGCGCGVELRPAPRFRQGHDAKLRGVLVKAAREGRMVQYAGQLTSPATLLEAAGHPTPAPKAEGK